MQTIAFDCILGCITTLRAGQLYFCHQMAVLNAFFINEKYANIALIMSE